MAERNSDFAQEQGYAQEQAHVHEHSHEHDHEHTHEHGHAHSHEHSHGEYVSNLPKFHKTATGKGTLYCVSVGSGDCGQLTLNAVQTIMHCPVIAAQRTSGDEMLAYNIAKAGISRFLELSFGSRMAEASEESFWAAKTVLPLSFPFTQIVSVKKAVHRKVSEQLKEYLDKGLDVAMVTLGDVAFHTTAPYIADLLKADGYEVKFVAGVPDFSAAAATLGMSLAKTNAPVHIISGEADGEQVKELLGEPGTKVFVKSARALPDTLAALMAEGIPDATSVVVNCGLPGEKTYSSLHEFETALLEEPEAAYSYFTTLIIQPSEEQQ